MTKNVIENGQINREVVEAVGDDHLNGDFFLEKDLAEAVKSEHATRAIANAAAGYRNGIARLKKALITRDPAKTVEKQYLDLQKDCEKWHSDSATIVDRARAGGRAQLEGLENDVAAVLEIKDGPRADAIRTHAKAFKSSNDRLVFIRDAIDRLDKETLAAIFVAPDYLSGLTGNQKSQLLSEYRQKAAPALLSRIRVLHKALAELDTVSASVMEAIGTLFPKATIEEIKSRVYRAQTARDAIFDSGFRDPI